jgi:hypothetical protein
MGNNNVIIWVSIYLWETEKQTLDKSTQLSLSTAVFKKWGLSLFSQQHRLLYQLYHLLYLALKL